MELDSDPPTVRAMLYRLRANGQPMRQEIVRAWLKKELETRTGHKRDTNGTHRGTHENPIESGMRATNGTHVGTKSGTLHARNLKVLIERDETENSVSYSETSSRDGKKNDLREPTPGEDEVLRVCYDWERGISTPLPSHLKPLLDEMRTRMELPRRPGA